MLQARLVLFIAITGSLLTSCRPDKDIPSPVIPPPPVNEEELITTVMVHLTSLDGTEEKHFMWRDLDGEGGDPPVITAESLTAGVVYSAHIELLNETADPPENITEEIEEEDDEHQFFFIVTESNVSVAYADLDANGDPVGLETVWTTGGASNGSITIILRHDPDKSAPGVSSGNIANAGGDTDVEVTFPLVIQ